MIVDALNREFVMHFWWHYCQRLLQHIFIYYCLIEVVETSQR